MRPQTVSYLAFFGILLVLAASRCGRVCVNQAQCPDGSWTSTTISQVLASMFHRDRTATQKTLQEELAFGTGSLPSGYRQVPDITKDDDGQTGGSVTVSPRAVTPCGTTQATVAGRIASCASANSSMATWDGTTKGNAGEGVWKLVTYNGAHEVWRDERTQWLWSDRLGVTNWCRGTGSSGGGPLPQADPSGYCNNGVNQDQTTPESWCTELTGFNTPSTYDSMKGGMRLAATSSSPAVVWRLPTKYDYALAEVNGLRFTLPNLAFNFMTATVSTLNRQSAWFYYADGGYFDAGFRNAATYSMRCLGRES